MRRSSSSSRNPDDAPARPFPFVESRAGRLYMRIRLSPRASRAKIDGVVGGALKIRITAPPVEGEANRALISFLSGLLGLPRSSLSISPRSLKSKDKLVEVYGASEEELCARLKASLTATGQKQKAGG